MPDAAAWKSRSIYQVLTDRFACNPGTTPAPAQPNGGSSRKYEGGTWRGLISRLDYIQGMGFDAVWISPVIENIPDSTRWGTSYHGYWPLSLYHTNPHFGTAADLHALVAALHARSMYLMVDIVVNHMGSSSLINFSRYVPFNSPSHYHPQKFITDYGDEMQSERGWLGDESVPLPDLDTENADVVRTLYWYINAFVKEYKIDGLRLDTVKHIRRSFWPGFVRAAGVFCMGEVLDGNPDFLASYQPFVGGLLDYAGYYHLKRAFVERRDMGELAITLGEEWREKFEDVQLLGRFCDNHDVERFTAEEAVVRNTLAWCLLGDGVPVVYYGIEQGFRGAGDPGSRNVMWSSGFRRTGLYGFIGICNKVRRVCWERGFGECLMSLLGCDKGMMVVQKGPVVMVLSNGGRAMRRQCVTARAAFRAGTVLVDVVTRKRVVTSRLGSEGKAEASEVEFEVVGGEVGIYVPIELARVICDGELIEQPTVHKKKSSFFCCFSCGDEAVEEEKTNKLEWRDGEEELNDKIWDSGIPAITGEVLLPYEASSEAQGRILYPASGNKVDEYALFPTSSIPRL